MANVVVVGAQWGDEGKGKIVDWLSERADIVVRFQGGHNAGHTLVIDGVSYKLSLLPSGVVRPGKLSIIGNGVVVDPWAFVAEVERLKGQGVAVTPDNLLIADNAALILPLHRELDVTRETANVTQAIGTTKRGIGPAYEDKVGRRAIRVVDLADPASLPGKIDRLLAHHNALRRGIGAPGDRRRGRCSAPCSRWRRRSCPSWARPGGGSMRRAAPASASCSKAPRASSSMSTTAPIPSSPRPTSSPPRRRPARASARGPADYVLGITKAYTTRVGEGPFPTEDKGEMGERLGTVGKEFGTVTGRKRRCGWFDAALVRQVVRISGINGIALTKLDVLDGLETIKISVGYRLGGRSLDYLPVAQQEQAAVEPVYETMEGWQDSTAGARTWNDLPAQAVKYVRHVEELIGVPVALLSTSPERDDTILVHDPFQG